MKNRLVVLSLNKINQQTGFNIYATPVFSALITYNLLLALTLIGKSRKRSFDLGKNNIHHEINIKIVSKFKKIKSLINVKDLTLCQNNFYDYLLKKEVFVNSDCKRTVDFKIKDINSSRHFNRKYNLLVVSDQCLSTRSIGLFNCRYQLTGPCNDWVVLSILTPLEISDELFDQYILIFKNTLRNCGIEC